MLKDLHIEHDWATLLALVFGAAVIVPSLVSACVSLAAVAAALF